MEKLPETGSRPALTYDYFPARWQAVLFRNWGHVPPERLAALLSTDADTLRREAAALGLDPALAADPRWLKRGYLNMIRENWHLLPFEQITALLDITPERLAFLLKEDDFLWHKMGQLKPFVEPAVYSPLTPEQQARTEAIRQQLGIDFPGGVADNAFAFVDDLLAPVTPEQRQAAKDAVMPSDRLATVYSYFALYGDPLAEPELDPFPEALLAEYARMGVKGVWLQGVLYQLVEFPFAPELSAGRETRIATLQELVRRAARYDIGVYLYLNEPRSMEDAFFQKYPHLRGAQEGDFWAMCTSQPEVRDYLEKGMEQLFSQVPGLAGFFTITMSENLTNCYSRCGEVCPCPRCARRPPEEIIAEVNNCLARGAKRAAPNAKAIAWSWAWREEWAEKVPALLTEGQIVQCTSEESLRVNIDGVESVLIDYTMSLCGPGPKAKAVWQAAKEAGLDTCAKTQFNNTWELAAIPWIPVMDKVAGHIRNLKEEGVTQYQMSWTLGGWPSPNLHLAAWLSAGRGTVSDFLRNWLGEELGAAAHRGQKLLCEAFSHFPFHVEVVYRGPQNYGPMSPFFGEKTGWNATMVGFPYDDLDGWSGVYSREQFRNQFRMLTQGWRRGVEALRPYRGRSAGFDQLLLMAESALCHFDSTRHHAEFVTARDAGDKEAQLCWIRAERETVKQLIALRKSDSRLGYEASNHYFYTMNGLAEKLVNLWDLEQKLGC